MGHWQRVLALLCTASAASLPLAAQRAGTAAGDPGLKVTDTGYLRGVGVSVMLSNDVYSPIFFDQKDSAMQIILHDERIATNGSVRLAPTPEQWGPVPHLDSHQADKAHNRLTANLSYADYHLSYQVEVAAESGGFRVTVNLDQPLAASMVGRAGFNLEFLPTLYEDKPYSVDNKTFGMMPRYPEGQMTADKPQPGDPEMVWYQKQWREARAYMVPKAFAQGQSITLAAADPLHRITVSSDSVPIGIFDGRNQAQNGWFVLRSLLPAGKTQGALVWHIRPSYIPGWTRPPMIAHSQVGYAPAFPKVAVVELDPAFDAPRTAKLLRLNDRGTFEPVFEAPVSAAKPWLRYTYVRFDFSSVRQPGLYRIEYAGQQTDTFPIAEDVYSQTWQTSLDGFMAVQMDHIAVKDAYHTWHGLAHMDDAEQAPANLQEFDGYWMGPDTYSPYKAGQHIPGLNIGGWFDAGDFDSDVFDQLQTVRNLALTETTFHPKWDELTVNETTRSVVMHQPDGIPDIVQQVEHGVLQTLAQIHAVGHPLLGIHASNLQQYTFVGDAASQTDGHLYNPALGPNETEGNFSGKNDDRYAWTNYNAPMDYSAIATLAASSVALRGYNDALSKQCLDAAVAQWTKEKAHPGPEPQPGPTQSAYRNPGPQDWTAALELLIATGGGEPYKARIQELFPTIIQRMDFIGWTAVRALPYLNPSYKAQFGAALKAYLPKMRERLAQTPFDVPPSTGAWGDSTRVADYGVEMFFLHQAFPQLVGPDDTVHAANYLLGTHPASNVSFIAGIGAVSKLKTYSNNRGDDSYIPGAMIPGYIVINPDFPECITDFGMLWFEDETTIGAATSWILEANAAETLVREQQATAK